MLEYLTPLGILEISCLRGEIDRHAKEYSAERSWKSIKFEITKLRTTKENRSAHRGIRDCCGASFHVIIMNVIRDRLQ